MAKNRPLHSGPGVHVPDGLGGYLDVGGIKVTTRAHNNAAYQDTLSLARNRIRVMAAGFFLCFALLCVRLIDVTILPNLMKPSFGRGVIADTRVRGDITDRSGVLMATNLLSASLSADTREVWDPETTADAIRSVLPELSRARLLRQLKSGAHSVQLARHVTPRQKQRIFALGLPGIYFPRKERRYYPRTYDAAHVLGYVDADNRGIAGVEKSMNDEIVRAGLAGESIALSLDMRVQHVLQTELAASVNTFRAKAGAGIVLDVHTGEVLAMASLPDFNPNQPMASAADGRFNQVTKGVYELGSVFKMFTVAMALDNKTVTLNDGYDTSKPLKISRFQINDFHGKNRWLSVSEIFQHSSNIGTAKIARDVGIPQHQAFLRKLGMFEKVPFDLPEMSMPKVPARWREVRAATISYGHGIAVSPLHLANAAAAMVNGGRLLTPTILKRKPGETIEEAQVLSPNTSRKMRDLLRLVVTDGTGGNAEVDGYFVGGKTGTAEKSVGGGYARRALISSFIATFPTYDPQYVVFVMLDEPQPTKETFGYATAGWTAAPLTNRLISRIGPLLGVVPKRDNMNPFQQVALELP